MNGQSRLWASLVIGIAGCSAALALLAAGDSGTRTASDAGDCRSAGWSQILTGGWGAGDCR